MSEVWYDEEADAMGIMLKNRRHWKGVEVSKHVIIDLAKDGEIVGIEILGVREAFKEDAPLIVSRASTKKR
jgi:uncharacterized protein YuzE